MRKKNRLRFLSFAIVCVLLLCLPMQIQAQESGKILIKADIYKDQDMIYSFPNVTFTMYQVAEEQDGEWVLKKGFESLNIDFDFEDATKEYQTAKTLESYIKQHKIQGVSKVTDQNGKLMFADVKRGIYLIRQPKEVAFEGNLYESRPFLVSIPGEYDGEFLWDITVEPKFSNRSIPDTPSTQPKKHEQKTKNQKYKKNTVRDIVKTGDTSKIGVWMAVFLSAWTILVFLLDNRRKGRKGKRGRS